MRRLIMARKVFYSFNYDADAWRVQQIRNMKKFDESPFLSSNRWEEVRRGGDAAIQKWIDENMSGRSCVIVLIGASTADRKWVDYEIKKAWNDKRGLLGIHIHKLEDANKKQSAKGTNPFASFTLGTGAQTKRLSSVVKVYDPPRESGSGTYNYIANHIEEWVEEAIRIRNAN